MEKSLTATHNSYYLLQIRTAIVTYFFADYIMRKCSLLALFNFTDVHAKCGSLFPLVFCGTLLRIIYGLWGGNWQIVINFRKNFHYSRKRSLTFHENFSSNVYTAKAIASHVWPTPTMTN